MALPSASTLIVPPPILSDLDDTLPAGATEFIATLQGLLASGETLTTGDLATLAQDSLGAVGSQAHLTPKLLYDLLETALHRYLLPRAADWLDAPAPDAVLDHLQQLLARLPTPSVRRRHQTLLQQFSTPPTLAFLAAYALQPQPTDILLEPSAGTGALALWGLARGAALHTNEICPHRRQLLRLLGLQPTDYDAEHLHDLLPADIRPTAVLMNPPFSATGGRVSRNNAKFGLRHLTAALTRLADGGRLVALMGQSLAFSRPAHAPWWRSLAARCHIRANIGLPGAAYAKYGTAFGTQLIVIDKTGPTPGADWATQLKRIIHGPVASLAEALALLTPLAHERQPPPAPHNADDVASDVTSIVQTATDHQPPVRALFVPYAPARLTGGVPHPAPLVEAHTMSSVLPPPVSYRPRLPRPLITTGRLSNTQLERVIYAGQAHETRLPDGARSAFMLGDGTGTGKGRTLAAIIADNWFQQRRRALWVSVSGDLRTAARRDFQDLGFNFPLALLNDFPPASDISLPEGVIFCSYSALIAQARNGSRRLDQLLRWLGPEGVVVLDESHKAKNALATGRGQPTQTGLAVVELQNHELRPDLRVVYASATGATEVRNLAYLTRLGLWGYGTGFPGGFSEFLAEISNGGYGAMELVCRDLKALGKYASCSISFGLDASSGLAVEYREAIHRLTLAQREMYDATARAWQHILRNFHEALDLTQASSRACANAMTQFWATHQRCSRNLITAFKMPTILAEIERALSQGHSALVSLIGTGESKTRQAIARQSGQGGLLEDLDFSPREVIAQLVDNSFPTQLYTEQTDPATQQTIQVAVQDKEGNPVHSQEALALRQELLDHLSSLELPEHPLDQLINYFGAENVAELTGRQRRLIRRPDGRLEYCKRAPAGVAMNRVNLYEQELFQQKQKRIAVISEAASTGISLHADRRAPNRQRREHLTAELNWSADKQMQTFGRSHRSNQAAPPIYLLVFTELGGEKRFASTIAKRLGSLGALTKGDRSASGGDLTEYNFETPEGAAALNLLYTQILAGQPVPGLPHPRATLRQMGLLATDPEGGTTVKEENRRHVPRFLNRLLALAVAPQNALFDHYFRLFQEVVAHARANGTFDNGVEDIRALSVQMAAPPRVVHLDEATNAPTVHYTLRAVIPTQPISWAATQGTPESAFYRHRQSQRYVLITASGTHTNPESGETYRTYALTTPAQARQQYLRESELLDKYQLVPAVEAESWWRDAFAQAPCQAERELHIIGGAILPLWPQLKSDRDSLLNVVRVTTDDGQRVVGILLPKNKVGPVLKALRVTRRIVAPADIARAVLEEGETLALQHGLSLKPTRMYGSTLIEVTGASPSHFAQLRATGLLNLAIDWKQRFFVPGTEERETVLTALLTLYPALAPEAEGDAITDMTLPPLTRVVAEDWVIPPDAAAITASGFAVTAADADAQPATVATGVTHLALLTPVTLTQTGLF